MGKDSRTLRDAIGSTSKTSKRRLPIYILVRRVALSNLDVIGSCKPLIGNEWTAFQHSAHTHLAPAGAILSNFKIYLAGPEVFLPEFGKAVFDAKKAMCEAFGFEGISPMDADLSLEGLSAFEQGVAIYRGNLEHMRTSDGVIANMTPFRGVSMDPGTAFEMGFMAASGKPVLGYTHVTSHFHGRSLRYYEHGRSDLLEMYSAGTSVEQFGMPDNLMMVGAVDCVGFKVQQIAVAPGEELTSLAGFRLCLVELRGWRGER